MTAVYVHRCDNCGAEASGYSLPEVLEAGWKRYVKGAAGWFVMCADCVARFEPLWEANEAIGRAA